MELILESKGSKLSKDGKIFVVKKYDGEKIKIPTVDLERIIIQQGIQITSDAIILALNKGIDIFIYDNYNKILGKITNDNFGSTNKIRRNQYSYFSMEKGTYLGKKLLLTKFDGFIKILEKYKIEYEGLNEFYRKLSEIEGVPNDVRANIMGYEGNITKLFYQYINRILPLKFQFSKREHQNAQEKFNIYLNYIYGILYRICENELIKSGIDIYIGIFHTDDYNKKAFLFDFIEEFRPYAIDALIEFILKKYSRNEYIIDGEISFEGRKALLDFFKKYLQKKEIYNEKFYERKYVITLEARRIASLLKEDL
jgi:CRISPR-associated protein Cas1